MRIGGDKGLRKTKGVGLLPAGRSRRPQMDARRQVGPVEISLAVCQPLSSILFPCPHSPTTNNQQPTSTLFSRVVSMASSGSTGLIAASASHAKIPGTAYLDLGKRELRWVPQSPSLADQTLLLPFRDVDKLLAGKGKPGGTTFSLKIVRFPGTGTDPIITFTAPEGRERAEADRERFKEHLFSAATSNKEAGKKEEFGPRPSEPSPAAASNAGVSTPQTPTTPGSGPGPVGPRASEAVRDPSTLEQQRKDEIQLRIAVLAAYPDLQALHKELVFKKVMKDKEFWAHPARAALLRAERMARAQRRGRNARIADPRPTNDAEGNLSISLSADLVKDVFEQYPLVAKAYGELVPSELDEQSFWTRYFQSRLYHRLRTSARSAASEHITRADPLFDQYLADVVDDSEPVPRRNYDVHEPFLDLGATELDHEETGNTQDFTMRAGYNRSHLPLLRHFNTHSTSLLDSALGKQASAPTERRITGGVGEEYPRAPSGHDGHDNALSPGRKGRNKRAWDQIVIEELEPSRRKRARPLQVADERQAFFQGRDASGDATEHAELGPEQRARVLEMFEHGVRHWANDAEDILSHFSVSVTDNERAQAAIDALVRDHRASERDGSDRGTLPHRLLHPIVYSIPSSLCLSHCIASPGKCIGK